MLSRKASQSVLHSAIALPLAADNASLGDRVNVVSSRHALEAAVKQIVTVSLIVLRWAMDERRKCAVLQYKVPAFARKSLHPELEVIGANAEDAVPDYLRKSYLS